MRPHSNQIGRKSYRLVSIYLLIWIRVLDAQAQHERYELTGIVIDSELMTEITEALVILDGTVHGTLSDSVGEFELTSITRGTYLLTVSADGYVVFQRSIEIQNHLHLTIALRPKIRELPDTYTYLGRDSELSTQIFRYLIPRRVDAITTEYSLFDAQLNAGSIYYDGIRLIDYGIPIFVFADVKNAEFVPDPYHLNLGFNASAHFSTLDELETEAIFDYDSQIGRLTSELMLHQDWLPISGTLVGIYDRGKNYLDGSDRRQFSGIQSGTVAGRIGIQMSSRHVISGSGGWSKDQTHSGREVQQTAIMMNYKYASNHGFIRKVNSAVSIQELESDSDILQQGGHAFVDMVPQTNVRLRVGADYYRYIKSTHSEVPLGDTGSNNEAGMYANARYRFAFILIENQIRVGLMNHYWGGSTILNWLIADQWRITSGAGYTQTDSQITQANLGVQWNGFERSVDVMTFTRRTEDTRLLGLTALLQGSQWRATLNSSHIDHTSENSQQSTWMGINYAIQAPFDLFIIYPEVFGTFFHTSSWISGNCMVEWKKIGGVSLRMGVQNIFDATYTYPLSEFSEPGRSFRLTVRYQSSS